MIDIVILSNANSKELKSITDKCIYTVKHFTPNCNIIVIEQCLTAKYNETTIYKSEPFNYNKFANIGAKHGVNDYICIANNDLIFTANWFDEILKTNYPICSPICPDDKRQKGIVNNEIGDVVGRNLSGWCFVIKRSLWEIINGFDEDFSFWCADNSLVEQLKEFDILPMLVPSSKVYHLGSKTLKTVNNRDELTRQQVVKFNRKYNKNLFNYGTE
ncbi:MAG: hypothetical protein KAZ71_09025 [Bacteroidia bacterium]|nr:hypothetical protein [Bacteroidia bacterium]